MSKPRRKCANCGHDRTLHTYAPGDLLYSGPGACSGTGCKCRCYVQARAFERVPNGRIHLGGECPRCDAADKVIEGLEKSPGATPAPRWTREGRCLMYDGKPAIGVDRVVNTRTHGGTLEPVQCDAIAALLCDALNSTDLDALTRAWMAK